MFGLIGPNGAYCGWSMMVRDRRLIFQHLFRWEARNVGRGKSDAMAGAIRSYTAVEKVAIDDLIDAAAHAPTEERIPAATVN